MLTRVAGALVDLNVTELAREADHTATDVVTVTVDARSVVTVHRGAAVNMVLTPVSLVTYMSYSKQVNSLKLIGNKNAIMEKSEEKVKAMISS